MALAAVMHRLSGGILARRPRVAVLQQRFDLRQLRKILAQLRPIGRGRQHLAAGIDHIGGGRLADLGLAEEIGEEGEIDIGERDAGVEAGMRHRDRHRRPRAAEFGRRIADAAGDGVGEADVAGKIRIAADHARRAARHLQLLVAGAVEQRELADRRHLVEQLGVVGIVLRQRLGVGAGHPADLPLQLRDRLLDPPGGGLRLLAHRAGERGPGGAVGDPGLHRAVDREHEDHEPHQREHVFGEQALPERPDLVLDADHPDPRKQPPRRPSFMAVPAGSCLAQKQGWRPVTRQRG